MTLLSPAELQESLRRSSLDKALVEISQQHIKVRDRPSSPTKSATKSYPNSMLDPDSPPKRISPQESREWDASKVPPSQFQKRKGSIYSTPSSRDGHVKGAERDRKYFEKIKEMGWNK